MLYIDQLEHIQKTLQECSDTLYRQNDVGISIGQWRRLTEAQRMVCEALEESRKRVA